MTVTEKRLFEGHCDETEVKQRSKKQSQALEIATSYNSVPFIQRLSAISSENNLSIYLASPVTYVASNKLTHENKMDWRLL
jgi:hypothetical protein